MAEAIRISPAVMNVLKAAITAKGAAVAHDPADPLQVAFWEETAAAARIARERYPGFFDRIRNGSRSTATRTVSLAASAPAGTTGLFADGQYVEYVSTIAGSGIATARATMTRTRKIAQAVCSLRILNKADDVVTSIAAGTTMVFGSQTIQLSTDNRSALNLPATGQNWATLSWSIEYADGGVDQGHTSSIWSFQASKDPPSRHRWSAPTGGPETSTTS